MYIYELVKDYDNSMALFKNENDAIDALYTWCETMGWEAYEYEGRHYGEFTSKRSGKKHVIEIRSVYVCDSYNDFIEGMETNYED